MDRISVFVDAQRNERKKVLGSRITQSFKSDKKPI